MGSAGQLQNAYPELTQGKFQYVVEGCSLDEDGRTVVRVTVTHGKSLEQSKFLFTMEQYPLGRKKGCFLTKSLLRAGD